MMWKVGSGLRKSGHNDHDEDHDQEKRKGGFEDVVDVFAGDALDHKKGNPTREDMG